jgi:protein required for attachment to host cells
MDKKKHKETSDAWFVLIDEEQCRLLTCARTKHGRVHVEDLDAFENPWPRPERGRPQALGAMTGHSYASPHHGVGEQLHRFVNDAVTWLERKRGEHAIDHLLVLGPPRLVGELRKASWSQPASFVELREGNLMRLHADELAEHPTITGLVSATEAE